MSKMGISTVASYTGAQIFEAIGLDPDVVDRTSPERRRRLGGVGLDVAGRRGRPPPPPGHLERPTERPTASSRSAASTSGGARASTTSSTPRPSSSSSTPPGRSATTSSRSTPRLVDDQSEQLATLRGLLRLRTGGAPAGPARRGRAGRRSSARFSTGAMSLRVDLGRGPRDPGHRHEPPRRPVEHRRGRRGPGRASPPTRTATSGAAPSSRWPRAASA